ncbi:ABC transporter permease [Chitinophaga horti]|uniref:ABC transporter permease n=1 Tax=Chitinophaga horti TaxID=2920382 RepID=A0ABY6J7H0_9BACT|nr:ABC transporter permease [Chitinophaga horti]UYQ95281.1 ABC transporter permease [Chitinophaga horti]
MLRNHLVAAWRAVLKQKTNTVINIAGLTLGIAACLIIYLVVKNELTYDAWHQKSDRIYRVTLNEIDFNPSVSTSVLPAMLRDFPEIEQGTQVMYMNDVTIGVDAQPFADRLMLCADTNFLRVFDYTWLKGNQSSALTEPNSLVLTETTARKYFGAEEPIGQTVKLDNRLALKVTGVVADPPANTHMPFRFLLSLSTLGKDFKDDPFFDIRGAYTYIVLPEGRTSATIEAGIPSFITRNWGADIASRTRLPLQPLKDIHFDQRYLHNNISPTVSRTTYVALAGVALFVLITACINFINLATAQALKRAREVGVRKTLGSSRTQLVAQFMLETGIVTGIGMLLALGLTAVSLPSVSALLDVSIRALVLFTPQMIMLLLSVGLVVVLLAGLYPAFVQSSFAAAVSLKGKVRTGGLGMRKTLVVTQFVISQVMIAGTLIVAHQMDYFRNRDLGFDKEAVITMRLPDTDKRVLLAQQVMSIPGVEDYTLSVGAPTFGGSATYYEHPNMVKGDVADIKMVDERYFDMFGLQLLAGEPVRALPEGDTSRSTVINMTMLRSIGYKMPQQALGQRFVLGGQSRLITGVINDFQEGTRHKLTRACVLFYDPNRFYSISIKLSGKNMRNTIAGIEKSWSGVFPDNAFSYAFIDDHIVQMYRQEQKVYTAFRIFSLLSIFIGCLGLYGLVTFAAAHRTKEVGIRKVLGASAASILGLFGKEFMLLILVAFFIATPLAFVMMQRWLNNFAYQVNIGSSVFIITLAATFVIAAITIAHQAIKAACMNPAKSLKSE